MPRPPPLSCDCHIHVFGPFGRYPLDPARKYTPAESTLEDYRKVAAALGTGRVVPEDQGLLDALFDCVPDEATRHRILVDRPAELYRFR